MPGPVAHLRQGSLARWRYAGGEDCAAHDRLMRADTRSGTKSRRILPLGTQGKFESVLCLARTTQLFRIDIVRPARVLLALDRLLEVHPDIGMVWIPVHRTRFHPPRAGRRLAHGQHGPSMERLRAIRPLPAPFDCDVGHHFARCVIQPIDGDLVHTLSGNEHMGCYPGVPCPLGLARRVHAPTEVLVLGQGGQALSQGTGREAMLPACAGVPRRRRWADPKRPCSVSARPSRQRTRSSPRRLGCRSG